MRRRLLVALSMVALGACSSGNPSASPSPSPTGSPVVGIGSEADLPEVPPTDLKMEDLEPGEGEAVTAGDRIVISYMCAKFSTGKFFDTSNSRGGDMSFQLGAGGTMVAFDEGIQGMRVGGMRRLLVPPSKTAGELMKGKVKPNDALMCIVSLLERKFGP